MFHITSGSLHHIGKVGSEEAVLIIAFRHEHLEDFSFHASFGAMTDAILGNTNDLASKHFSSIPRTTSPKYVSSEKASLISRALRISRIAISSTLRV